MLELNGGQEYETDTENEPVEVEGAEMAGV
jgi:hypothetical protein